MLESLNISLKSSMELDIRYKKIDALLVQYLFNNGDNNVTM